MCRCYLAGIERVIAVANETREIVSYNRASLRSLRISDDRANPPVCNRDAIAIV